MIEDVTTFTRMLHGSLAPITLVSGIGLLMLCMTARFVHCTNRIRQLVKKRSSARAEFEPYIDSEIRLIYRRANMLRVGTFLLSLSALFSALIVVASIVQTFWGFDLNNLCGVLLFIDVALIIGSSLLFSLEIKLSLRALSLQVLYLKDIKPKTIEQP